MGDEIADVEVVMVRAHLKEIYESQEIKIRLSLLYVWYCSCFNIRKSLLSARRQVKPSTTEGK